MTNPLPSDNRPYGSLFRTTEVMKVSLNSILEFPPDFPNPHDKLKDDILCPTCSGPGNVNIVDPLKLGDGPISKAPVTGHNYLWGIRDLKRNHRCSLCRLVWRTFRPFYEKLAGQGPPHAMYGINSQRGKGEEGGKWIQLVCMVAKSTMDNQDIRGSGQIYIYEDERIPHFGIAALATTQEGTKSDWLRFRQIQGGGIDFELVQAWLETCREEHGSKCGSTKSGKNPTKRLIDVKDECVVDGSDAGVFVTLSYTWGTAEQLMLKRPILEEAYQKGFFKLKEAKVPQTIKDAMLVCQKIGVRYLWVDALCILQDDDEDKRSQIAIMDEIYSGAFAVLVCASGDGANSGIPGVSGTKRELVSYVETVKNEQRITYLAGTTASAKSSTWNTRAWTYQEYILGNRLLVFTDTQVFFHCPKSTWRDDMAFPAVGEIPSVPLQSDDRWITYSLNSITNEDPKAVWKEYYNPLLALYLRRQMKYDSDALNAFSGVLKVLSKSLGPFHFGMAKQFFGKQFLWGEPHQSIFRRRSEFPSWSWAGWEWRFHYFQESRAPVGAYGYEMPKQTVPLVFYTINKMGKVVFFCGSEETKLKIDERITRHFEPQKNIDEAELGPLLPHIKHPDHLIAFFTSYAVLRIERAKPLSQLEKQKRQPGVAQRFGVSGRDGSWLFDVYLDPEWRETRRDNHEFIVVGVDESRVVLMLIEFADRVYRRVSWKLTMCTVNAEIWMSQGPVQRFIVMN